MIKNIFAFIGVVAVMVSILGMTHQKPKAVVKSKKTEITESKVPMTKEYWNLINKKATSKKVAKVKETEITETKIVISKEEAKQLLVVE
jgi:cell division protein FtsL